MASRLIHPRHRAIILAFYEFVRVADDISDHETLTDAEKLAMLDQLEAALLGNDEQPEATRLRIALKERGLSPRHAQDLLTAFRLDVTKLRYRDWDDLIEYCSYSAMPVGRFVLDVHEESRSTWPANDALCAALQIINHLQDCKKDYQKLNRVYVPLDALEAAGLTVEVLGEPRASAPLLRCLHDLTARTDTLLRESAPFPLLINDTRLALEVSVIHTLAQRLIGLLATRDPLSERVHLSKAEVAMTGVVGIATALVRRLGRTSSVSQKSQDA